MPQDLYGCRDCGRMITAREAEERGRCRACWRLHHGTEEEPSPAESERPQLRKVAGATVPLPTPSHQAKSLNMSGNRRVRPILTEPEPASVPPPKPRVFSASAPAPAVVPDTRLVEPPPPAAFTDDAPAPALKPLTPAKPQRQTAPHTPPAAAAAIASAPPKRQPPPAPKERPELRLRKDRQESPEMAGQWYVQWAAKRRFKKADIQGPLSWKELSRLMLDGSLQPFNLIRRGAESEWQPAGDVEALFNDEMIARRDQRLDIQRQEAERIERLEARRDKNRQAYTAATTGAIWGGLGSMALAIVWFFGALIFADRIFFYPPILFVMGLVSFFKGLSGGA